MSGLHDDLCATKKGHRCNCPRAALTAGAKTTNQPIIRLYQPSSGCEGMDFMARFCDGCEFNDVECGCPILNTTMALKVTDPDYPNQWRDNPPRCISFVARFTIRSIKAEDRPVEPMASLRQWAEERGLCAKTNAGGERTACPKGTNDHT